jgi:hypothetical protein
VVAYFCISAGAVERGRHRAGEAQCARHDSGVGHRAIGGQPRPSEQGSAPTSSRTRFVCRGRFGNIGMGAVLVHAKDEAAKRFYIRCAEFIEYPEDSRTLFLPIETVIAAFG